MNIITKTYLFFNLNNFFSIKNSRFVIFISFFSIFYYILQKNNIINIFMNNDMQDMNEFLQSIIDNVMIDSNNEIETNEIDSNNEVETNEIDSNEDDVYIPCEICMNNVLSKYYYFHLYLCMQTNINRTRRNTTEVNSDIVNVKLDNFKDKVSYLPVLEKTECPICFSIIKETICDLPCSHSFCKKCIEEWAITTLKKDSNLIEVSCPLCQKNVRVD
tara:strand:- start:2458 stop:3108 length:651 start_codon:yes stop_codon:yes gene_type:complete